MYLGDGRIYAIHNRFLKYTVISLIRKEEDLYSLIFKTPKQELVEVPGN